MLSNGKTLDGHPQQWYHTMPDHLLNLLRAVLQGSSCSRASSISRQQVPIPAPWLHKPSCFPKASLITRPSLAQKLGVTGVVPGHAASMKNKFGIQTASMIAVSSISSREYNFTASSKGMAQNCPGLTNGPHSPEQSNRIF